MPLIHRSQSRALVTAPVATSAGRLRCGLARAGLHVIVHANSRLALVESLADEIKAAGGRAEAWPST